MFDLAVEQMDGGWDAGQIAGPFEESSLDDHASRIGVPWCPLEGLWLQNLHDIARGIADKDCSLGAEVWKSLKQEQPGSLKGALHAPACTWMPFVRTTGPLSSRSLTIACWTMYWVQVVEYGHTAGNGCWAVSHRRFFYLSSEFL